MRVTVRWIFIPFPQNSSSASATTRSSPHEDLGLTGSAITEEKSSQRKKAEGGEGKKRATVDVKGLLNSAITDATAAALASSVC